jgi:UDP-N-acetyl-D-mannosaminuronic acid transferase (WecB/TagA/CpsF family)
MQSAADGAAVVGLAAQLADQRLQFKARGAAFIGMAAEQRFEVLRLGVLGAFPETILTVAARFEQVVQALDDVFIVIDRFAARSRSNAL